MSRGSGEGDVVRELSGYVTSRDKIGIVGILKKIKEDEKIFEDFVGAGGVEVLIKVLRVQNAKILDYALSLLANAFLKSWVREETKDPKLTSNILWILRNLPSGETLHCRACRLIGNMCLSKRHAASLCAEGVLPTLTTILQSEATPQTHSMAVRALRNIWESQADAQRRIIEAQLIRDVSALLVSSSGEFTKHPTQTKYRDLAETCLKALKTFLEPAEPKISAQIRTKENFSCVLDFCKLNHRIAIQILYKLSRAPENRPELGNSGAVECLVKFLKGLKAESSSASVLREVVKSLCLFSREAVNRARIRESGGLQVMLRLLDEEGRECYHPMLLHALTQFVYDESSVAIMIKNGIVGVLVGRLNKMASEAGERGADEKGGRKRSASAMSPEAQSPESKFNRISGGRFSLDFCSNEWSPCSANSPTSSPSSSPPLPYYDFEKEDEENYSPVCSDTEEFENDDTKSTSNKEEIDSLNSFICASIGRDDKDQADPDEEEIDPVLNSEVNFSHMWTLALLTKLTFWSDPIEGLADATTIQALTGYIEASKNFRAPSILNRIINNHVYFLPLLLQGFVFEAQSLENSRDYLEMLSRSAESGGAFGELSSILRRGQESHRFMVALSVPFLLKSRDKLHTLLTKYGGLELIFQLLADGEHFLNENSIFSVCQLAEALGVVPTSVEKCTGIEELSCGGDEVKKRRKSEEERDSLVTFELDDGGTVEACRRVLCGKSDVFTAMLEGKFFEAGQARVRLQNVSTAGLSVLYLAASGKLPQKSKKDAEKLQIESLLDAVLLADKFLMLNESEALTETSMAKLTPRNLSRAWNWARTNGCSELRICCVKNFLTSRTTREDRIRAFKDFSGDRNFREFLDDVRGIINEELSVR